MNDIVTKISFDLCKTIVLFKFYSSIYHRITITDNFLFNYKCLKDTFWKYWVPKKRSHSDKILKIAGSALFKNGLFQVHVFCLLMQFIYSGWIVYWLLSIFTLEQRFAKMFMTRSEYDRSPNQFSPEGRLFQVYRGWYFRKSETFVKENIQNFFKLDYKS